MKRLMVALASAMLLAALTAVPTSAKVAFSVKYDGNSVNAFQLEDPDNWILIQAFRDTRQEQ